METNINSINESVSEILFNLTPDDFSAALENKFNTEVKKIALPGFRKGKAPRAVIEKMYGAAIRYEAAEKVATDNFYKHIEDNKIHIYGTPKITEFDFEPAVKLTYKIQYEHKPVFELKQYKGFEINVPDLNVTDEILNEELKRILAAKAVKEPAEIIDGDNFVVSVELIRTSADTHEGAAPISIDPIPLDIDLSREGVHSSLRAALKGLKSGDPFEFAFEDSHQHKKDDGSEEEHKESLAYKGTVTGVNKLVYPEFTEELCKAESRGAASNEAELRELIGKDFQAYFDEQISQIIESQIEQNLLKFNDFAPPETLVKNYHEQIVEARFKEQKENREYKSKAELQIMLKEPAFQAVKLHFIEDEIVRLENLTVTDEMIREFAEKNADKMNVPAETLVKYYQNDDFKKNFIRKVYFDFLKNESIIKTKVESPAITDESK